MVKIFRHSLIFVGILAFLSFKLFPKEDQVVADRNKSCMHAYYNTSYGKLPFNTFLVKTKVKPNDYLGSIFEKAKIDNSIALELSNLPDSVFNVRRIKTGNSYAVLYEVKDKRIVPSTFIYEKNKVDYYVINMGDETKVELAHKPIEYVERITSGIITSSLYETMILNDANPLLAVELAEIYQWTIDFYRIQENDYFKAIYTEQFVEGESLGAFDIEASVFKHFDRTKYAFLYENDSSAVKYSDYYDEEGLSLKRTFLQAPVKYSRISSKYQKNRIHPVTGKNKAHLGTDYAAPEGTPIYATADGVITHATYKKYNGNYVKIKHDNMYTTQYLHMSKIASGMKKGVYVEQGEVIGYVGSTGLATGPHVCYRFWKNGVQVDPYKQDLPQAKYIDTELMEDFLLRVEPLKAILDSIELQAS